MSRLGVGALAVAALAAAILIVRLGGTPGAPDAGAQDLSGSPVPWQTDLAAARAQAKEEGRPLLVVFR